MVGDAGKRVGIGIAGHYLCAFVGRGYIEVYSADKGGVACQVYVFGAQVQHGRVERAGLGVHEYGHLVVHA